MSGEKWKFHCGQETGCFHTEDVRNVGGLLVSHTNHKIAHIQKSEEGITMEEVKVLLIPHLEYIILKQLMYYRFNNPDNDILIKKVLDLVTEEYFTEEIESIDSPYRFTLIDDYESIDLEDRVTVRSVKVIEICEWVKAGLEDNETRDEDTLIQRAFDNYATLADTPYDEPPPKNPPYPKPVITTTRPTSSGNVTASYAIQRVEWWNVERYIGTTPPDENTEWTETRGGDLFTVRTTEIVYIRARTSAPDAKWWHFQDGPFHPVEETPVPQDEQTSEMPPLTGNE